MAPFVPSIAERGEIGICHVTGAMAILSGWRLLVFQCAIDTSTSNADNVCNLLYSVTSAKQLPDPLVATNALYMAAPPFPFDLPRSDCLGGRKCLSSKLMCHFFEQTFMVNKELLQGLGEILLQMKPIDDVFGLGSASRCSLAEELAAIARDDIHLGVFLEPGGTRLHRALRQQSSYPPLFEVDHDRAIVGALLPGPFVYAGNTNGIVLRQGKLEHPTNDGFRRGGHAERRENPCRVCSIGGHTHRLERLNQPIRHSCVATDQFREPFGKDALGTRSVRTDPLAHEQLEHETSPAKGDIGNAARIATVDP